MADKNIADTFSARYLGMVDDCETFDQLFKNHYILNHRIFKKGILDDEIERLRHRGGEGHVIQLTFNLKKTGYCPGKFIKRYYYDNPPVLFTYNYMLITGVHVSLQFKEIDIISFFPEEITMALRLVGVELC